MNPKRIFSLILLTIILPTHFCLAQYDTLARKQTLIFDMGMGSMFLYDISGDGYTPNSHSNLYRFDPSINFQTTVGYALKFDRMSLEWKAGYIHARYYINIEEFPGGKGSFTSTTHTGSATLNAGFAQLLGVNFGKERSWGSLCIGANLRYNFIADTKTTGASIVAGSEWNGSVMVGVYEEKPFATPIYFKRITIGAQAGANIRINAQSEIQARLELNFNGNDLSDYSTFQALFCVGYVYVLKRDRRVMRKPRN